MQFAGGQLFDLAFYNNLATRDGSVVHHGDNQTGAGDGDDESLTVDLDRVHGPVDTIVLLVSSYQGHSLTWLNRAYCRVTDAGGAELATIRISGGPDTTGLGPGDAEAAPRPRWMLQRASARASRSRSRPEASRSSTCAGPAASAASCGLAQATRVAGARSAVDTRALGLSQRAGRRSRRRRPAWPRPRSRSCRPRSAACRRGRRSGETMSARPRTALADLDRVREAHLVEAVVEPGAGGLHREDLAARARGSARA